MSTSPTPPVTPTPTPDGIWNSSRLDAGHATWTGSAGPHIVATERRKRAFLRSLTGAWEQATGITYSVGHRVRYRALPDQLGTVVGSLDTPDYGPIPLVAFDDMPEHPEVMGVDEVELVRAEDLGGAR